MNNDYVMDEEVITSLYIWQEIAMNDLTQGIMAHEAFIPLEELRKWLEITEAVVQPLEIL